MDVCSRLSDKSTSSQEQDDDVKGDISSPDEVEKIPKTTPKRPTEGYETEEKNI